MIVSMNVSNVKICQVLMISH